jgi:anti-sigma B factor antagonist
MEESEMSGGAAGHEQLSRVESSAGSVGLERAGGAAIVRVAGALDLAMAPKLQQVVDRAARLGCPVVVIDLTETDFLASVGMAVLLRAHRQLHEAGPPSIGVRVVAAGRTVLRPLQMTRLDDELDIYPTLDEALRAA